MQLLVSDMVMDTVEWGRDERQYAQDSQDKLKDETRPYATDAARWEAVSSRAPQADGRFFYGVTTTGIYCRPPCASRLPKREHVRFFADPQAAEEAGFRPCKRCQPRQMEAVDPALEAVIHGCRLIEEAEQMPRLADLAQAVGLSPYHFHRLFKKHVGVTPKRYADALRAQRVGEELQQEAAVTEAIYNAGFASSSRFYETAVDRLGMKPTVYREGGPGMTIRYAIGESYLGAILVAATDQGICGIDIGDDPRALETRLQERFAQAELVAGDANFRQIVEQVLAFLERPQQGLDLPLDIQGTAFQQRVWSALRDIPAGVTKSYAEVAAAIGQPTASRAVASACAANQIAVAIPCHRVVRSDGGVGGYRWGLARKRALLQREAG